MMAHGAERISTVHCPSIIHTRCQTGKMGGGGKYINVYPLHEKAKIYIYIIQYTLIYINLFSIVG